MRETECYGIKLLTCISRCLSAHQNGGLHHGDKQRTPTSHKTYNLSGSLTKRQCPEDNHLNIGSKPRSLSSSKKRRKSAQDHKKEADDLLGELFAVDARENSLLISCRPRISQPQAKRCLKRAYSETSVSANKKRHKSNSSTCSTDTLSSEKSGISSLKSHRKETVPQADHAFKNISKKQSSQSIVSTSESEKLSDNIVEKSKPEKSLMGGGDKKVYKNMCVSQTTVENFTKKCFVILSDIKNSEVGQTWLRETQGAKDDEKLQNSNLEFESVESKSSKISDKNLDIKMESLTDDLPCVPDNAPHNKITIDTDTKAVIEQDVNAGIQNKSGKQKVLKSEKNVAKRRRIIISESSSSDEDFEREVPDVIERPSTDAQGNSEICNNLSVFNDNSNRSPNCCVHKTSENANESSVENISNGYDSDLCTVDSLESCEPWTRKSSVSDDKEDVLREHSTSVVKGPDLCAINANKSECLSCVNSNNTKSVNSLGIITDTETAITENSKPVRLKHDTLTTEKKIVKQSVCASYNSLTKEERETDAVHKNSMDNQNSSHGAVRIENNSNQSKSIEFEINLSANQQTAKVATNVTNSVNVTYEKEAVLNKTPNNYAAVESTGIGDVHEMTCETTLEENVLHTSNISVESIYSDISDESDNELPDLDGPYFSANGQNDSKLDQSYYSDISSVENFSDKEQYFSDISSDGEDSGFSHVPKKEPYKPTGVEEISSASSVSSFASQTISSCVFDQEKIDTLTSNKSDCSVKLNEDISDHEFSTAVTQHESYTIVKKHKIETSVVEPIGKTQKEGLESDIKLEDYKMDIKVKKHTTNIKMDEYESDRERDASAEDCENDNEVKKHIIKDTKEEGHESDSEVEEPESDSKAEANRNVTSVEEHESDGKVEDNESDSRVEDDESDSRVEDNLSVISVEDSNMDTLWKVPENCSSVSELEICFTKKEIENDKIRIEKDSETIVADERKSIISVEQEGYGNVASGLSTEKITKETETCCKSIPADSAFKQFKQSSSDCENNIFSKISLAFDCNENMLQSTPSKALKASSVVSCSTSTIRPVMSSSVSRKKTLRKLARFKDTSALCASHTSTESSSCINSSQLSLFSASPSSSIKTVPLISDDSLSLRKPSVSSHRKMTKEKSREDSVSVQGKQALPVSYENMLECCCSDGNVFMNYFLDFFQTFSSKFEIPSYIYDNLIKSSFLENSEITVSDVNEAYSVLMKCCTGSDDRITLKFEAIESSIGHLLGAQQDTDYKQLLQASLLAKISVELLRKDLRLRDVTDSHQVRKSLAYQMLGPDVGTRNCKQVMFYINQAVHAGQKDIATYHGEKYQLTRALPVIMVSCLLA